MRIIIFLSILLSGCGTFPAPYVEPLDGPLADFTVENNSDFVAYIYFFEESHECKSRQSFAQIEQNQSQSTIIKADQEVSFESQLSRQYGTEIRYCRAIVKFNAEKGTSYKFITTTSYIDGQRVCGGNMYKVDVFGNIVAPVETRLSKPLFPFNQYGSFCVATTANVKTDDQSDVDVKTDDQPEPVNDFSGIYRSQLSKSLSSHFGRTDIEIKLVQNGNKITGTFVGAKGYIDGEIDGNTIEYEARPPYGNWTIEGEWVFTDELDKATGDAGYHVKKGSWNLTRIK